MYSTYTIYARAFHDGDNVDEDNDKNNTLVKMHTKVIGDWRKQRQKKGIPKQDVFEVYLKFY